MSCPRCGEANPSEARFCMKCGASVTRSCARCATELPAGAQFCFACGQAATGAGGLPPAAPAAYTPRHLAERILTSKAALEGERKQVTVLFADLKGSMELLADRDPEDARRLLDPVLQHMMDAVHRYEGTVNQVMGDGIMALFGAPLAHEDHAVRACYAALRMQEAVTRHAEGVRRDHGVAVRIRVGLNSGEVVVRTIGSDLHMDYTAVGQTTHLAARMEQLADPGAILLAPETVALAEGFVQVKALGPMAVRGLAAPVEVYELRGASEVRSRLQAAAARGLARFVGRDPEMEQLRRALRRAADGHGQVAAITGDPGLGKSRLVYEFTRSHHAQGWLVLEASSVSYGKATSYLPVIDLLKGYARITDRDSPRDIREKATGKLLALDRVLEPTLPALLALLDVPGDDAQWARLDPPQRRQRTLDAVKRLLLREAQVQPVVVVFEDLHWIDGETQALLDALVESIPAARMLLLVNYRPEYRHGWGGKTYYMQMRLDALPAETASDLLDALLGGDASVRPLKALLAARTGGNPLFLEESVRSLAETGALAGERAAYRLTRPVEAAQVPATVQAILAARIDRLPVEDKRLLQAAAVIGKDVPFSLLRAIAGLGEDGLQQGLAQLQAAEFLYEARLFPDLEYTFKHALTHDVAYGSLLHDRRRSLHGAIVRAIEQIHADRLAEQVEKLAHHALRGELWDEAAIYAHQAGVKAAGHSAYPEAIVSFEQALAVLERLPETPPNLERAVDVRLDLRNALWVSGQLRRGLEHLQAARPLAERLGDRKWLARLWGHMSSAHWMLGDYALALDTAQRALALGTELDDFRVQVDARHFLGMIHHSLGDYARSCELLSANVAALSGAWLEGRFGAFYAVSARAWLAMGMAPCGQFDAADALAQEGVRIAEAAGYPGDIVAATWSLGYARLHRGDLAGALSWLERAETIANDAAVTVWQGQVLGAIGYARALQGDVEGGVRLLETVTAPDATENGIGLCEWRAGLAEAYLLASRLAEAEEAARRALAQSRRLGERPAEAQALRVGAEIAARRGLADNRAGQLFDEALALADQLGMHPLAAHCHAGLARLCQRAGAAAEAHEHFTKATAIYRDRSMSYWPNKAQGELAASEL